MKIELLDVRVTTRTIEVLFRVVGTPANDDDVAGKTLGYNALLFSPTATAQRIAEAVLKSAARVRETGIRRHQLWRDIEALL